jgi:hypothetical protein
LANITIPATGLGTAVPIVTTDVVSADSSNVQLVSLATVSAGVLTRSVGQKVAASSIPVVLASDKTVQVIPRALDTQVAVYRVALAAATSALAFTYTANTDKQLATIYHASGTGFQRIVRLQKVTVEIVTIGAVAGQLQFELRRLTSATTPATGNPAITPVNRDPGGVTAEAICLALPTTAGTDFAANSPIASRIVPVIASEAAIVSTWPINPSTIVLYDAADTAFESEQPTIRAGSAEGYAVVGRSTAAVPTTFIATIVFTEE